MIRILAFGDSNTHGYIPGGFGRYDESKRWTKLLDNMLGDDFTIIEEGLNGRTACFDDPKEPDVDRNGSNYLLPCLKSHEPLDLTIIMLGSNDMKNHFNADADIITANVKKLAKITRDFTNGKVLIVSPILLGEKIENSDFGDSFDSHCVEVSKQLADKYKKAADELGVFFMNAADYADPSPVDSLHMSPECHMSLAKGFYETITNIFS